MHEFALAQSICDVVKAHVQEGQRVIKIVVECGPMCGVVPESLDQCFPIAADNAGFNDVILEQRPRSAKALCAQCDAEFDVMSPMARCPECNHSPVTIRGGRELIVKEFEVENV